MFVGWWVNSDQFQKVLVGVFINSDWSVGVFLDSDWSAVSGSAATQVAKTQTKQIWRRSPNLMDCCDICG